MFKKDQRWIVDGSIDKKTGKPYQYVITYWVNSLEWKCSCSGWTTQPKYIKVKDQKTGRETEVLNWVQDPQTGQLRRKDCKHILNKKLELSIPADNIKRSNTVEEVTRSISFEDV